MPQLLDMSKEDRESLLRSLWRAIRVLRSKMEVTLPSSSTCEEGVVSYKRMLFNSLTPPI